MSSINVFILLLAKQRKSRQGVGIGLGATRDLGDFLEYTSVRADSCLPTQGSPARPDVQIPSLPLAFTYTVDMEYSHPNGENGAHFSTRIQIALVSTCSCRAGMSAFCKVM